MEFDRVLRRRRMVRAYDATRGVPPDTLDAVLGAAIRAPSAGFTQGVSFLVLTAAEQRNSYWRNTVDRETRWVRGLRTAPVLILVWTSQQAYLDRYAEPDKGWTPKGGRPRWTHGSAAGPGGFADAPWPAPYWYVDGGMAAMAALLSAVDHELGACFFGIPLGRVDLVRQAFDVPPDQLSVGVISLGYPDPAETPSGSPRTRVRRIDLTHRERW